MHHFSNGEYADMHFIYGAADGVSTVAQRLYRDKYPSRQLPDRRTFERLHRQLSETGSFFSSRNNAGRGRYSRTTSIENTVLTYFEENPSTSTRSAANLLGVSQSSVWRTLREDQKHPYHIQKVQDLKPEDYRPRVNFAQWYLRQADLSPEFPSQILFTDEATFTRPGIFNTHNFHIWSHDNPHETRQHAYQDRFSVNVWAGIVHDHIVGPYILPIRLNGETYNIFLQELLPELLNDVPVDVRSEMWFQHDGAPAHFSINVRNHLDATYGQRWIGRGGPVAWPPRSPDLTCLDFFLWGYMKSLVYETEVESKEDLVARIVAAAGEIRDKQETLLPNVRRSMKRRCETCIAVGGRKFEHLL